MKHLKLFLICLIIVPALAFAGEKTGKAEKYPDVLNGKEFNLVKYPSIMIGFRNGGVYGYALINTFMGRYELISDKKINLSYMASTKVDGTDEQVNGEFDFFNALYKAKDYSYNAKTGSLKIGKMDFKEKK